MDWSQLTRLGLGISCPQHLFEEIGPRLRSFKSLKMGIRTGDQTWKPWRQNGPLTCESLSPVLIFIESLPDLCEISLSDMDHAAEVVAPVVLGSQKSVREFSYVSSMHRYRTRRKPPIEKPVNACKPAQLQELGQQNPELSRLEVNFRLALGRWIALTPQILQQ